MYFFGANEIDELTMDFAVKACERINNVFLIKFANSLVLKCTDYK